MKMTANRPVPRLFRALFLNLELLACLEACVQIDRYFGPGYRHKLPDQDKAQASSTDAMAPLLDMQYDSAHSSTSCTITKRRVSFAAHVAIKSIGCRGAMSSEEIAAAYYSQNEHSKMKKCMIPVIRAMMKGETIEESNDSTARGMEYRTRKGAQLRQRNKVVSITSVLDEQDRQRSTGYGDVNEIRDVYLHNSAHCLVSAHQLGLEDEVAAREIMDEPLELPVEEDFSDSESASEEFSLVTDSPVEKFKGFNKLVKKFHKTQQTVYNDLAVLAPAHVQGMPQAA
jgi:hypothetical protein